MIVVVHKQGTVDDSIYVLSEIYAHFGTPVSVGRRLGLGLRYSYESNMPHVNE